MPGRPPSPEATAGQGDPGHKFPSIAGKTAFCVACSCGLPVSFHALAGRQVSLLGSARPSSFSSRYHFSHNRAHAVREFGLGVFLDVALNLAPIAFVVADFLQLAQIGSRPLRDFTLARAFCRSWMSCSRSASACLRSVMFSKTETKNPFFGL